MIVAFAFAIRLAIGMQETLDPDEAAEAVGALRLLHGELLIMEPNGRYLGALDCYLMAPFLAVMGPTLLAVRVAMSVVGALYVLAMAWLGRVLNFHRHGGLVLAAVAAVFPLFAVSFGVRARGYSPTLLLEALFLVLAIRVIWPASNPRRRDWAAPGLVAGLALWLHPLLAMPVGVALIALMLRARKLPAGWLQQGLPVAIAAGLIGFAPWLVYNGVLTQLGSIRHLYSPLQAYSVSTLQGARGVTINALPIFLGVHVTECGQEVAPWPVVDGALLLLAGAVVWLRRRALAELIRGRPEPAELVFAIAPVAVLAVTLHWFNALSCEPRYLFPLAIPLAFAVAYVLVQPLPWRGFAIAGVAAWLAGAGVTTWRSIETTPDVVYEVRANLAAESRAIAAQRPEAVWTTFWLARPVEFYAGDQFVVGEYGGYVGFRSTQEAAYAAEHPSWLFVEGDPTAAAFETECARRGITYTRSEVVPGLVLYSNLSAKLTPDDLGLGGQRVDHTDPDPPRI